MPTAACRRRQTRRRPPLRAEHALLIGTGWQRRCCHSPTPAAGSFTPSRADYLKQVVLWLAFWAGS